MRIIGKRAATENKKGRRLNLITIQTSLPNLKSDGVQRKTLHISHTVIRRLWAASAACISRRGKSDTPRDGRRLSAIQKLTAIPVPISSTTKSITYTEFLARVS